MSEMKLFVILGNQLFSPKYLLELGCTDVYMAEDFELCTSPKHHKLKLYLFLTAMREYKDELTQNGIKVHYQKLVKDKKTYIQNLDKYLKDKCDEINFFDIEDKPFESNFLLLKDKYKLLQHRSPMFLLTREEFRDYQGDKQNFRMASFYKFGRQKFNILLDEAKDPVGGKWSFDEENRKKIPKGHALPNLPVYETSSHHVEVVKLIKLYFDHHPGQIENIWFPVTRKQAKKSLKIFLDERIKDFGIYEDAMVPQKNFLFHSTLSPSLNMGLITPKEVLDSAIKYYKNKNAPLNSIEGFVRQILGWREFIRGIYQEKGTYQIEQNFWGHKRRLSEDWYNATTGIDPLDDCIKQTIEDGYHHHIPRLMIISNIMNMCEVHPDDIYRWFMEMFIDSSDWVMTPNVYGMATYSDGGLMSTKPYTCGSNYILKMSNYSKGDWCDIVDGLYWRFTDKHRSFYEKNARMGFMTRTLDRMDGERKKLIFSKAEDFIKETTYVEKEKK